MKSALLIAAVLTILLAGAVIAGEIYLPGRIEKDAEKSIVLGSKSVDEVDVRVRSFPALSMLLGRFDEISAVVKGYRTEDLRIESLTLTGTDVRIDTSKLSSEGRLVFGSVGATSGRLLLAEKDINDYFRRKQDFFKVLDVRLEPGKAIISGDMSAFLGTVIRLSLEGHFVIESEKRARYVVDRFLVQDIVVPSYIKDEIFRQMDLTIDLPELPFPMKIRKVSIRQGSILITGGA